MNKLRLPGVLRRLTSPVRPEKRSVIPAVTLARPSAGARCRPRAHRRAVVMNTSFNLRGEPIVTTPTDAIRTFFSSGMDALVMGSYLVEK